MAFHHLALATRDLDATHAFYTEAMGFTLVKTVVAPTDSDGGWAKHVFYDTGATGSSPSGTCTTTPSATSTRPSPPALGLPMWVNHIAFHADARRARGVASSAGSTPATTCMEVDHGFCVSIYTVDPNGILVEWCADTRPLDARPTAPRRSPRSPTPARRSRRRPTPTFHQPRPPGRRPRRLIRARPVRPFLGYWPDPADDPGGRPLGREPVTLVSPDGAVVRGILWTPPGRHAVAHRGRAHPPARRLQRPLRLPAARRRRLRGARLRHPLREQRHRLPARELRHRRRDRGRRAAPPRRRAGRAARQQRRRLAHGAEPGAPRPRAGRPLGDAFVALAAHPGEGVFMLQVIDPSVTDEADPFSVDPTLDMYDPDNGWRPVARAVAPTTATGSTRYRAAQRARVARIDAVATRLARRPGRRPGPSSSTARAAARAAWNQRPPPGGPRPLPHDLPDPRRPGLPRPVDRPRRPGARHRLRRPRPARRQLRLRRPGPHDDRTGLAVDVVRPVVGRPSWPTPCRRSPCRRWSCTRPATPRSACTRPRRSATPRAPTTSPTSPSTAPRTTCTATGARRARHHRRLAPRPGPLTRADLAS